MFLVLKSKFDELETLKCDSALVCRLSAVCDERRVTSSGATDFDDRSITPVAVMHRRASFWESRYRRENEIGPTVPR